MPPLRHAMRFIDGEQRELAIVAQAIKQIEEARGDQALRRHVQQLDVAGEHLALDAIRLFAAQRRIQK